MSKDNQLNLSNIFWFGNFNYSLNNYSFDRIDQEKYDFKTQLEKTDELFNQMKIEKTFEKFKESPIEFPPTLNGRNSKGEPKYNNRILYCSKNILKPYYNSINDLNLSSDPVYLRFFIDFTHQILIDHLHEDLSPLHLFERLQYLKLKNSYKDDNISIESGEIITMKKLDVEYEYKGYTFKLKKELEGEEMLCLKNLNEIRFLEKKRVVFWGNMLSSERDYVRILKMTIENFVNPLKNILDPNIHKKIFHSIQTIYNLNFNYLKNLEENWVKNDHKGIVTTIQQFVKAFKLYIPYYQEYQSSFDTLIDETKKNSKFTKFLSSKNILLLKYGLDDLQSILILPIQRLKDYKMYFEEIFRNPHEMFKDQTKEILENINEVVFNANEKSKEYERLLTLFLAQKTYQLTFDMNQELIFSKNKNSVFYMKEFDKIIKITDFCLLKGNLLMTLKTNQKMSKEYKRIKCKEMDQSLLQESRSSEKKLKNVQGLELIGETFILNIITEFNEDFQQMKRIFDYFN